MAVVRHEYEGQRVVPYGADERIFQFVFRASPVMICAYMYKTASPFEFIVKDLNLLCILMCFWQMCFSIHNLNAFCITAFELHTPSPGTVTVIMRGVIFVPFQTRIECRRRTKQHRRGDDCQRRQYYCERVSTTLKTGYHHRFSPPPHTL